MVGNSRRDYRCAVCGAPFRRPKIAKSSRSRDRASGTQASEEDYEGLDPAFFTHRNLDWLREARVIGTHSHDGYGVNRAFVSEPGTVSATRGHGILNHFYRGDNTNDVLYDTLRELCPDNDVLALNLDYDIKIDNTFQDVFVPGIIAADPNARRFRMSSPGENKVEKRYWDDPLLSSLLEPAEASLTDVFHTLPPEIVFHVISYMDLRSLFRALKALPAIYELISNNFGFWKQQLGKHFPWYRDLGWYDDDLREYVVYGHPDLKGSDLMRVAFQLQEMPKLDNFELISMANERRIRLACKRITDKVEVKWRLRKQLQQKFREDPDEADDDVCENDLYDLPFCAIMADSHCNQLSAVHGITARRDRDLRSIYFVKSSEEFKRTRTFEAYFDDYSGLVGLSFAPFGESRYFGREGVNELAETALETDFVQMKEDSTILRRRTHLGGENSSLRKVGVEIEPDRDVIGIVLHMLGTNSRAYKNTFSKDGKSSTAEAPSVLIRGLTVCFRDYQSILVGDDCKQDTSGRVCHRPLLLPSRQDEYELTGLLGHTTGEVGEETILSLGLLTAAFVGKTDTIEREEAGSININPLAELLWKESSAFRWNRWIWQCDNFLWLNNLIPEITREVESNIFNNDIVPNELIAWIDEVGNVTLKRLSAWLASAGSPLPVPERCGIPGRRDPRKYNLCGLRAELSSGEIQTIGAAEISGTCWPEDEIVHFDVDVENGEEINEIGVASDAEDMPSVYMRTNRDREVLFARGSDLPDQWNVRQNIEIHGDLVYGVVMGFGQPTGWVITQGLGDVQQSASIESPNTVFQASFAGMSYIGALSGFFMDGESDQEEPGEQHVEGDSNEKD